ncbi:hypothetical protein [Sphingobium phenoxybenzoativorans]|uniref:hypothetical protein n=1 Tax=Sphingobium phenoxybenzoativorans TaxID=1592790 RepID=UPI00209AD431|nr:hypothetical protein [Sphingobium phenoxybenzoativorans]
MNIQTCPAPTRKSRPPAVGHNILYRKAASNPCPGCGKSQWLVGRVVAECAFCETALPLEHGFRFSGLSVG